jgi:hypothetical protein
MRGLWLLLALAPVVARAAVDCTADPDACRLQRAVDLCRKADDEGHDAFLDNLIGPPAMCLVRFTYIGDVTGSTPKRAAACAAVMDAVRAIPEAMAEVWTKSGSTAADTATKAMDTATVFLNPAARAKLVDAETALVRCVDSSSQALQRLDEIQTYMSTDVLTRPHCVPAVDEFSRALRKPDPDPGAPASFPPGLELSGYLDRLSALRDSCNETLREVRGVHGQERTPAEALASAEEFGNSILGSGAGATPPPPVVLAPLQAPVLPAPKVPDMSPIPGLSGF